MNDPTPLDACRIASAALGIDAVNARRFPTGLHHFVYEAALADGRAVVVRMTRPSERGAMRSAISLNRQLRALGVPLPELLAAHADDVFPWMVLEVLPGTDLGNVVGDLSPRSRREIAIAVAAAQAQVATLP